MAVPDRPGVTPAVCLRSALYMLAFSVWTAIIGGVGLPFFWSRRISVGVSRIWAVGTEFLLKHIIGLTHRVEGGEHRPSGPAIYASQHQSAWETIMFWRLVKGPCYILKRELLWIPIVGWYMWASGNIPIDRGGGASTIRTMVKIARARIAEGRSIVIYPEGTRIPYGTKAPLKPGIVALTSQLELPIVPVTLDSGRLWPKNSFLKFPGVVTVRFHPALAETRGKEVTKRLEGIFHASS